MGEDANNKQLGGAAAYQAYLQVYRSLALAIDS